MTHLPNIVDKSLDRYLRSQTPEARLERARDKHAGAYWMWKQHPCKRHHNELLEARKELRQASARCKVPYRPDEPGGG